MAAIIQFRASDDRGAEILDELEERTREQSRPVHDGVREFYANGVNAGVDAFDAMLTSIDKDWRSHLDRL